MPAADQGAVLDDESDDVDELDVSDVDAGADVPESPFDDVGVDDDGDVELALPRLSVL